MTEPRQVAVQLRNLGGVSFSGEIPFDLSEFGANGAKMFQNDIVGFSHTELLEHLRSHRHHGFGAGRDARQVSGAFG